MPVAHSGRRFKYAERPAPCQVCGSYTVWNGRRCVSQVVRDSSGAVRYVAEEVRWRARCADRSCAAGSFTVYAASAYPHRVFQLPVVASAVGTIAFAPDATLSRTATDHACSRRSVVRWCRWVADLAEPSHLARACARLDPDGLAGVSALVHTKPLRARAGSALRLLDRLSELLLDRGVALPAAGPGLARILAHQHRRFGDIFRLTGSSPPLRVDLRRLRL